MYQKVKEEKFNFFYKKLSKSSEFYYLEPGLYPFITDKVETMNTLTRERHDHSDNCTTLEVSRGTEKADIYFANERSGLEFFSTDIGHFFGSNIGKEFGVMLRRRGSHKLEFPYDFVRIHCQDIQRP